MRRCVVFERRWTTDREVITNKCEAQFHQFVQDVGLDGSTETMALVEYSDGTVAKVRYDCIRFVESPLESGIDFKLQNVVDDLMYRLRETLNDAATNFRR